MGERHFIYRHVSKITKHMMPVPQNIFRVTIEYGECKDLTPSVINVKTKGKQNQDTLRHRVLLGVKHIVQKRRVPDGVLYFVTMDKIVIEADLMTTTTLISVIDFQQLNSNLDLPRSTRILLFEEDRYPLNIPEDFKVPKKMFLNTEDHDLILYVTGTTMQSIGTIYVAQFYYEILIAKDTSNFDKNISAAATTATVAVEQVDTSYRSTPSGREITFALGKTSMASKTGSDGGVGGGSSSGSSESASSSSNNNCWMNDPIYKEKYDLIAQNTVLREHLVDLYASPKIYLTSKIRFNSHLKFDIYKLHFQLENEDLDNAVVSKRTQASVNRLIKLHSLSDTYLVYFAYCIRNIDVAKYQSIINRITKNKAEEFKTLFQKSKEKRKLLMRESLNPLLREFKKNVINYANWDNCTDLEIKQRQIKLRAIQTSISNLILTNKNIDPATHLYVTARAASRINSVYEKISQPLYEKIVSFAQKKPIYEQKQIINKLSMMFKELERNENKQVEDEKKIAINDDKESTSLMMMDA